MNTPSDDQVREVHELSNKLLRTLGNTETSIALNALMTAYLNAAHQRGYLDHVPAACDAMTKAAAHLQSENNEMPARMYVADAPSPSSLH